MQKDGIDPEKLEATLNSDTLKETCDLKRALEMVTLLEAQLKDMNPNLDSISEYVYFFTCYFRRCLIMKFFLMYFRQAILLSQI